MKGFVGWVSVGAPIPRRSSGPFPAWFSQNRISGRLLFLASPGECAEAIGDFFHFLIDETLQNGQLIFSEKARGLREQLSCPRLQHDQISSQLLRPAHSARRSWQRIVRAIPSLVQADRPDVLDREICSCLGTGFPQSHTRFRCQGFQCLNAGLDSFPGFQRPIPLIASIAQCLFQRPIVVDS